MPGVWHGSANNSFNDQISVTCSSHGHSQCKVGFNHHAAADDLLAELQREELETQKFAASLVSEVCGNQRPNEAASMVTECVGAAHQPLQQSTSNAGSEVACTEEVKSGDDHSSGSGQPGQLDEDGAAGGDEDRTAEFASSHRPFSDDGFFPSQSDVHSSLPNFNPFDSPSFHRPIDFPLAQGPHAGGPRQGPGLRHRPISGSGHLPPPHSTVPAGNFFDAMSHATMPQTGGGLGGLLTSPWLPRIFKALGWLLWIGRNFWPWLIGFVTCYTLIMLFYGPEGIVRDLAPHAGFSLTMMTGTGCILFLYEHFDKVFQKMRATRMERAILERAPGLD
eukprot:GGOE01003754.1.p1 GENE.GGOE01003754.1~~GGOE01003754.1.p1  ORF type:complete len:335 (-),score=51.53 GGOE01003754.1:369-1373(-)